MDMLKDLIDRTIKSLPYHIKEVVDTKGDGSNYFLVISYLQVTFYFHFTCLDLFTDQIKVIEFLGLGSSPYETSTVCLSVQVPG